MVQTCNPNTQEAEARETLSSRPAWVYRGSSRTARTTQRNPVSNNQKQTKPSKQQKGEGETVQVYWAFEDRVESSLLLWQSKVSFDSSPL